MSEVKPGFARDWVEFFDPKDPTEIFKCDLTWLTSYWMCIYGDGCKGVFKSQPYGGCCTEGAMYSDKADELRTEAIAAQLSSQIWQFHSHAQSKKPGGKVRVSETDEDGERKTRRVEDGCIFLNRKDHQAPGYTGSFGCVLHHFALQENKHFVDTKPDVCWQLPLRRSFERREVGEREYSVTVIGEYERLSWGDGGEDFDWYCTSNTDAHIGKEPVYIANKFELQKLMGEKAYAELAKRCDLRMAGIRDAQARSLPLFVIQHPATLAAARK